MADTSILEKTRKFISARSSSRLAKAKGLKEEGKEKDSIAHTTEYLGP